MKKSPTKILFDIEKLNKKLNYPDNIHAIKLGELTKILNDIKQKVHEIQKKCLARMVMSLIDLYF